jgi:hypothetical protein
MSTSPRSSRGCGTAMSTNLRSEDEILNDIALVDLVIENIRPDVSPDNLNRVRRRLECELAAARIARRTANLNPRFASIFAASPLTRPVLAAADYGDPQDMSLEGLPGYPEDWEKDLALTSAIDGEA